MREKTLLKISLISGLAGLILLFGVLETAPLREISFQNIYAEDFRGSGLIRGTVLQISEGNRTQYLELVSHEPLKVTVFRDEAIPVKKGDLVEIRGEVQEYEGEKRFLGEEVRVI